MKNFSKHFRSNPEIKIFFLFVILYGLFIQTHVASGNVASRFATVQSLVEDGTFVIENTIFMGDGTTYQILSKEKTFLRFDDSLGINGTNDKIYVNGHYYSDKPPLLSVIAAVIYYPIYKIGFTFGNAPEIVIFILTFFLVSIPTAVMLIFYFQMIRKEKIPFDKKLLSTLLLGAATLVFPFAITFNNHIIAANLLFFSFFLLRSNDTNLLKSSLSGLFAGFAAAIDMVAGGIFLLLFSIYFLGKGRPIKYVFFFLFLIKYPTFVTCFLYGPHNRRYLARITA